jgi:hypothetical protein
MAPLAGADDFYVKPVTLDESLDLARPIQQASSMSTLKKVIQENLRITFLQFFQRSND